jgi:hypothetical protein
MDTQELDADARGFAPVTAESLACLGAGCFVYVRIGDSRNWVEIVRIDSDRLRGVVHRELAQTPGLIVHADYCEIIDFRREQIAALGCDRYCWC